MTVIDRTRQGFVAGGRRATRFEATIAALAPELRRVRTMTTQHRTWVIEPRVGTGPEDRWTVIADPIPAYNGNPAACIEDGQFAFIADARAALAEAIALDNGANEED